MFTLNSQKRWKKLPVDVLQPVIRITCSFGIHPGSFKVPWFDPEPAKINDQVPKGFISVWDHILSSGEYYFPVARNKILQNYL